MGVRNLANDVPAIRSGPLVRERVRWSDVDIMGIVYYGRYLRFVEAAEAEFFRALGYTYEAIAADHGVWFARVKLDCTFHAPARMDDEVVCRAELQKIGGSSLTFGFPIARADGTPLVHGTLIIAALDRTTLRATRIPAPLLSALRNETPA
ncbi:MAG TPA: thioesterase family protein [Candidatus Acidoferrum sp.]|nr:thioesterase family protein [Candidatus Acidoferrum sp.]